MKLLPKEIIYHILEYTGKFKRRNNKLMNLIDKKDERYFLLQTIPRPMIFSTKFYIYILLQIRQHKSYKIVLDLTYNQYKMSIMVGQRFFPINRFDTSDDGTMIISQNEYKRL